MAILNGLAIALAGLAACYVPEFRDCTVACAADTDCAKGHVCGDRSLCVTPEGSCGAPSRDAAPPPVGVDAAVSDAPPTPAPTGILRVKIADHGRVEVSGIGACDSQIGDPCDFVVELGAPRTLIAEPHDDREFERWAKACTGMQPTCIVVPHAPITEVEARFRKDD